MGEFQAIAETHSQHLEKARRLFFDRGEYPEGLVTPLIIRSWERCQRFGLNQSGYLPGIESLDRLALKTEQERNRYLLLQGRPIMEHVFEQIRDSGSMVVLADANGLLLETVGDADFVDRADRIALSAGASWDENLRGTNAIGTALAEELPTEVLGGEHFLEHNGFLTCCASPIFGPEGRLVGILNISGDYRVHRCHTMGLVRLASLTVERRLFEATHARDMLVCFHNRADYLGSPKEGIAAVSANGQILAINRDGLKILGIRPVDAVRRDFSMVFENNLASLIDRLRNNRQGSCELMINGKTIHLQLRGQLPPITVAGRVYDEAQITPRSQRQTDSTPDVTTEPRLDTLNTGDARLQLAIDRAKRILGRDIPLLIQGESGVGKEIFAQGFHNSGPRQNVPFVALNCASIPETLIESELFGYQGGAFTGARKEGAPGKIQQAHGGTLFLDEIGDMPLPMQVKLLRVIQERTFERVGSNRSIPADVRLVAATHRNLDTNIQDGRFREDLYYRLNVFPIDLPPLRERRDDIPLLINEFIIRLEKMGRGAVRLTPGAMGSLCDYPWPGNVRELANLMERLVIMFPNGLVDVRDLPPKFQMEGARAIEVVLPEPVAMPAAPAAAAPATPARLPARLPADGIDLKEYLAELELSFINQALDEADGVVARAAERLGMRRTTLVEKMKKYGMQRGE